VLGQLLSLLWYFDGGNGESKVWDSLAASRGWASLQIDRLLFSLVLVLDLLEPTSLFPPHCRSKRLAGEGCGCTRNDLVGERRVSTLLLPFRAVVGFLRDGDEGGEGAGRGDTGGGEWLAPRKLGWVEPG